MREYNAQFFKYISAGTKSPKAKRVKINGIRKAFRDNFGLLLIIQIYIPQKRGTTMHNSLPLLMQTTIMNRMACNGIHILKHQWSVETWTKLTKTQSLDYIYDVELTKQGDT